MWRGIITSSITAILLDEPPTLIPMKWSADYTPPPPPKKGEKREPEQIEAELKFIEKEMLKLVLLTIKAPSNCMWVEPPTVVRWNTEDEYWTTNGFYDQKFNEETQVLQVRMTQFGPIGLAQSRFTNLPFQSWEMKPIGDNAVQISIIGAVVSMEIVIKDGMVGVLEILFGTKYILPEAIGKYMKIYEFIQFLRSRGLDIFPEHDSDCYVEGITNKHTPTEEHIYKCMALCSPSVNFCWSRWNLLAGPKKMVFQFREKLEGAFPGNFHMTVVTPRRATVIDCTEAGSTFLENEINDIFYADLYNLVQAYITRLGRQKILTANHAFISTVMVFLRSSKLLTYT